MNNTFHLYASLENISLKDVSIEQIYLMEMYLFLITSNYLIIILFIIYFYVRMVLSFQYECDVNGKESNGKINK